MHWRGDRTGENRVNGETLEEAAFKEFNEAFNTLAGLGSELGESDMQDFTDFSMRINYPPNPIRQLNNSLIGIEIDGLQLFNDGVVRVQTGQLEVCARCHTLDPAAGLFIGNLEVAPDFVDAAGDDFLASFSGAGPTFEGFVKPEIVAGTAVNS